MKKSLAALLTGALVVGAASTTFAAANPFSDVPAGHWAYDAVAQLARDGVINGYGDASFRGDRNITRYEMAQMIAKAMAKSPKGVDKALLDKLIAEFRDELDNLGVRVAKLEKHADMVKWTGELRYRYWSNRDNFAFDNGKKNVDQLQLRLFPTAEVNQNWNVKARLTAGTNMKTDESSNVALTYAFAEGNYKNFQIKLGKQPLCTLADDGLVLDGFFSGASVAFGKDLKLVAQGGRWKISDVNSGFSNYAKYMGDETANYWGVEVLYNKNKWNAGAGYHHFMSDAFRYTKQLKDWSNDSAGIWTVGAKYKFDKNVALGAAYARNQKAEDERDAYNIQVNYKGIQRANKGTWGAHLAYRKLGYSVALAPTYDTAAYLTGVKGWDIGVDYVPFKNVQTSIAYFHGKDITKVAGIDDKAKVLFGRVSFFF
ncbi:MAG: S-layer homology domain-containing protein [Selenomonadaceae bacterium]|nr:S-layer homology domain-containing protein [Selenomonadaceae bacterium]